MSRAVDVIETPIGRYCLTASEEGLTRVAPEAPGAPPEGGARPGEAALRHLEEARAALETYFSGGDARFDALSLAADGTCFQREVWRVLRRIPFGRTASYGELARRIGRPGAARAVGAANGRNPIAIIVPCHRVIGASGALTGYAGGVERKRWLLGHEDSAS